MSGHGTTTPDGERACGGPTNCEICLFEKNRAPEPILQFFAYAHLPEKLAAVSLPFAELADQVVANLPRNAERTVALRKLLEAKDAAVRALVSK